MDEKFTLLIPSDSLLISLFRDLEKFLGGTSTLNLFGFGGGIPIADPRIEKAVEENVSVATSAILSIEGVSITYQKNQFRNRDGASAFHNFYSLISLSCQNVEKNHPNAKIYFEVAVRISSFISRNGLDVRIAFDPDETLPDAVSMVKAIQSSAASQVARGDQFFERLVSEFDARRQKLDQETQKMRDEYERISAERESEYQKRLTELDARRKEIEDRSNTHERRAIRKAMLETTKNRQMQFKLSDRTSRLRWPIHIAFVLLLGGLSYGSYLSFLVWAQDSSDGWNLRSISTALKSLLLVAALLTTSGLYISWMNKWFDRLADAELRTKQFEIDIERASWTVEAALEWQASAQQIMPQTLLEGFTKHLFETKNEPSSEYAPIDALASSLLGAAANVELNTAGGSVKFDRKGLGKLSS